MLQMSGCFSGMAIALVVFHFWRQRKWSAEMWHRFRERQRRHRRRPPSEQPLDPNFQFDLPADNAEERPGSPRGE